jgi:hypothetical protein
MEKDPDHALSKGEILSELKYHPYRSKRAYALRVVLSLLNDLEKANDDADHGNNDN